MKNKLYTAVGILRTPNTTNSKESPMVTINGKEYILDLHEMVLWCVLNWRILSLNETLEFYKQKQNQLGLDIEKSFNTALERLIQRGLIAVGLGETPADALYDLLSELYIVPISENIILRTISFVKLTFINKIPFSTTKQVFGFDKRTEDEKKVMKLAKQSLLSTAEIIKCVESGKITFNSEEQVMDTIYHDELTTCDNIAESSRNMNSCRSVLKAVSNLLLRRQIVLERV